MIEPVEKPLDPPAPSSAVPAVLLLPAPRMQPHPDRTEIEAELDRLEARLADLRACAAVIDHLFVRRSFEMARAPEEDLLPPVL
jgi:hypothetical protein